MAWIRTAAALALTGGLVLAASSARLRGDGPAMAGATDWPMWGGTPSRNMVSAATGLPDKWDVKTKQNIRWVADLGSQSYGNATVAGGRVFVGTNNELLRDPKQPGDRGVVMAFKQDTGEFLWQNTHEKVQAGRVNDWPFQGVCSSPLIENNLLYYTTNRCETVCYDTSPLMAGDPPKQVTFEEMNAATQICNCNGVSKGAIMACVNSGKRNAKAVMDSTTIAACSCRRRNSSDSR